MQPDHASPKNFTDSIAHLDELSTLRAKQWLEEGRRIWALAVVAIMISAFFKSYISDQKRKQGVPGLFASMNALMMPFLTYAKYWELKRNRHSNKT